MLLLTVMVDTTIIFTYARGFTHAPSINVLILHLKRGSNLLGNTKQLDKAQTAKVTVSQKNCMAIQPGNLKANLNSQHLGRREDRC